MRKQWLICLVWPIIVLPGLTAAQTAVTVYADDGHPPYSYLDKGVLKGIYPAIFSKVFARMPAYAVQMEAVPWKRGLNLMESGQGLALLAPYAHPGSRPYLDYSGPVLNEQVALYCRTEVLQQRPQHQQWPADFVGLVIANNTGRLVAGDPFYQAVAENRITLDNGPGTRSNLLKLAMGRVDCYVNDRLSVLWQLQQLKTEGFIGEQWQGMEEVMQLSKETTYLGISNRGDERFPFRKNFTAQINEQLKQMKKSGEINRIIEQFLKSQD